MRTLDVDWLDLELAFRDATGTESYLDLDSGEVVSVVPGFSDEAELKDIIARDPERYVLLEPIDTRFARDVMRRFTERMPEGTLRRRLFAAERKTGAYTRSLAILREDEAVLASYHRFEQAAFWDHVERYLSERGVAPETPAPGVELFEGPAALGARRSG